MMTLMEALDRRSIINVMGNKYYIGAVTDSESLQHFGIKGMKWGVRRYQNLDGTLTEEGKRRYNDAKDAVGTSGVIAGLGTAIVAKNAASNAYDYLSRTVRRAAAKLNSDNFDIMNDTSDRPYWYTVQNLMQSDSFIKEVLNKFPILGQAKVWNGDKQTVLDALSDTRLAISKGLNTHAVDMAGYKLQQDIGKTAAKSVLDYAKYIAVQDFVDYLPLVGGFAVAGGLATFGIKQLINKKKNNSNSKEQKK